jgi:hypothetical protein
MVAGMSKSVGASSPLPIAGHNSWVVDTIRVIHEVV